jgi:hypothetical protein
MIHLLMVLKSTHERDYGITTFLIRCAQSGCDGGHGFNPPPSTWSVRKKDNQVTCMMGGSYASTWRTMQTRVNSRRGCGLQVVKPNAETDLLYRV